MKLKSIIFTFIVVVLCGCSRPSTPSQSKANDDYVLVEFASKLEEDYHRINNQPVNDNNHSSSQHP